MSGHHHHSSDDTNLKWAFFLNVGFTIIEIAGGLWINSVAVLSDAIHDLGDSLSLGFSLWMQRRSHRPANDRYTYGYRRFSLLAALVNSVVIIIGSVFILHEAVQRLLHPEPVHATGMLWLSLLGIAVNGYASYRVSRGHTMNEKVVYWHLMEDMLGWVAVFIASVLLHFYDIPWIDSVLSIAIMLYIVHGVIKSLISTMHLFLQGVPEDVDIGGLRDQLLQLDGVEGVERFHIWSEDGEHHVGEVQLWMRTTLASAQQAELREEVRGLLQDVGVQRCTIQLEEGASLS